MKPDKNRCTKEYKEWRAKVFKRDGNKCQMPSCRHPRRKLQVHHIIKYSTSYYLRLEVANGIVICRSCHDSIKDKEHHFVELFRMIVERNEKRQK